MIDLVYTILFSDTVDTSYFVCCVIPDSDKKYSESEHITGAHVITRGIPLRRGPASRDERLRTLGPNSEARSERRRPDYNRLSCIQTVRGEEAV